MVAINITKPVQVQAKTLSLHMKVRDEFEARVLDQDGVTLKDYEGYVPGFMPGDHYGDYLILEIDIYTGLITNWKPVSAQVMEKFIEGENG